MENKEYPTYVFEERMESIKKNLRNYCNDTLDLHRKSTSLLFNFDEEILRPYFELSRVKEGVFGLATRLYGISFKENKSYGTAVSYRFNVY